MHVYPRVYSRAACVCLCMQGVCKYLYRPCVLAPFFVCVCVSVYVRVCIMHALHSNCTVQTEDAEKRRLCVLFPPFPAPDCAEGKASRLTETPRWPRLGTQFSPGKQQGGRGGGGDGGRVMAALVYRYYCCSCCRWCEYYHCNLQNFYGCWTNVMHLSILKADCSCLYLYSILLNTVIISNRIS